jgi:hypothetical protein
MMADFQQRHEGDGMATNVSAARLLWSRILALLVFSTSIRLKRALNFEIVGCS